MTTKREKDLETWTNKIKNEAKEMDVSIVLIVASNLGEETKVISVNAIRGDIGEKNGVAYAMGELIRSSPGLVFLMMRHHFMKGDKS